MPDWEKLTENLTKHGFTVHRFAAAKEAAAFIDGHIDGKTVALGGSVTLRELGLDKLLGVHNTLYDPWIQGNGVGDISAATQVYLTSVNGLAETGELINIDGHGNRVAATICGHEEVWFIVGVNKIAPAEYDADTTQGIDKDAITAAEKAQVVIENYAEKVMPFRLLMPAPAFDAECEALFQPREASQNGVGFVLASDDAKAHTAAIGLVLGRAATLSVHQSLGRVKSGAVGTDIYLTDGATYRDADGLADRLHDAGYIIPIAYPRKNGAYLNGDPTAAPATDDYSQLRYGRVIDKARIIVYSTLIDEILDNVDAESDGYLSAGQCISYASMIENAVMSQMSSEIESFTCTISREQNILTSEHIEVEAQIQPKGVVSTFDVTLGFTNPALKNN